MEFIVERLEYVRDVPVELTESALLAGALGKGSVVGVVVYPVSDAGNKVLIEVKLTDDGQVELLKPGMKVPLVDCGGRYFFTQEWQQYLMREVPSGDPKPCGGFEDNSRRPDPGKF